MPAKHRPPQHRPPQHRPAERWRPPAAIKLSAGLHGAAAGLCVIRPAWWPVLLASVAANHALLAGIGAWPRSQMLGPTLCRLPHPVRAVALTFDDGPDPAVTPAVLDQLAAAGATATFFCIGERALRHQPLVRRIVAEGHAVENHSYSHPLHFAFLAGSALRRQIVDAQSALADITGRAPGWFRAPMGIRGPLLEPALVQAGLCQANWTRRGYDTRTGDPDQVRQRLLRGLAAGDILLLHDGNCAGGPDGRAVVLSVLPGVLARLRQDGLSAVKLHAAGAEAASERGTPASAGYAST